MRLISQLLSRGASLATFVLLSGLSVQRVNVFRSHAHRLARHGLGKKGYVNKSYRAEGDDTHVPAGLAGLVLL